MDSEVKINIELNPKEWVNNYSDLLYGFAFTRVRSKDLAEDLIQETFISALKGMSSFKGKSKESTWLISILRNKIIDHFRKNSSKNEVLSDGFFNEEDNSWIENKVPEPWEDRTNDFDSDLFNTQMKKCISKLPVKNISVFTLKYIEEATTEELCKELNISSSNYWVIIHRTKLLLRECLEHNWLKGN